MVRTAPQEFARQQIKEVEAITGLDADVLGLMEVENNGTEAIGEPGRRAQRGDRARAPTPSSRSPRISPPNEFGGEFGTDAIKVAIIYRPAAVTPVGPAQTSADPIFDRPPLIQTFEPVGGGEAFTVVVNHFKSKNCAAGSAAGGPGLRVTARAASTVAACSRPRSSSTSLATLSVAEPADRRRPQRLHRGGPDPRARGRRLHRPLGAVHRRRRSLQLRLRRILRRARPRARERLSSSTT